MIRALLDLPEPALSRGLLAFLAAYCAIVWACGGFAP